MQEPTYTIKSKSGQLLVSGTARQVREWIREQRLSGSDEMQRKGWQLHESDEAWARLEAFPEFFGPSGWRVLEKRTGRMRGILIASVCAFLAGLSMVVVTQLMPAYDANLKIQASKDAEISAIRMAAKAKESQESAQAREKDALAVANLEKERALEAARRMDEQIKATANAESKAHELANQIEVMKKTMPIIVRWRKSYLDSGSTVMIVTNVSPTPLKLLVSIYDGKGVQTKKQFSLNMAPAGLVGAQAESGIGETVAHYFKRDEAAEFTDVDASKQFRFTSISYKCP